jgi:PIN domain nuclease of toxin-antitoxin system
LSRRVGTGGLAIAGVTLYEIAWLSTNDRVAIDSLDSFLANTEQRFVVLPLKSSVARLAAELPASFPGDPMDRIIAATALDQGVPLITKDRAMHRSNTVPVVW